MKSFWILLAMTVLAAGAASAEEQALTTLVSTDVAVEEGQIVTPAVELPAEIETAVAVATEEAPAPAVTA